MSHQFFVSVLAMKTFRTLAPTLAVMACALLASAGASSHSHRHKLAQQIGGETTFTICPESHPYAFAQGEFCCASECQSEGCLENMNKVLAKWTKNLNRQSLTCKDDAFVECDEPPCEDRYSICDCMPDCGNKIYVLGVNVTGFADNVDGMYIHAHNNGGTPIHVNNRPVYVMNVSDTQAQCQWWHREFRHWWIGPCEMVGSNAGFAFFDPDEDCPFYRGKDRFDIRGHWKLPRTGQEITTAASIYQGVVNGVPLNDSVPTTGIVDHQLENSVWARNCKWTFRQGNFVCK